MAGKRRLSPGLRLASLGLVAALLLAPSALPRAEAQQTKPIVYVFIQVDAKPSVIEKVLQERLPDLTIAVYGRFRDFEEGVVTGHPDALLAITPILDQYKKKVALQGQRGGKATEAYLVASVGQPLSSFAGKTIGVVDILGREGTQSFLTSLLRTSDVKMKRVPKVEDLLPLLQFSAVDAIVLPAAAMIRLGERTRLAVKTVTLAGPGVGLPAVSTINTTTSAAVIRSFMKLDPGTKALLGIDSWSAR